MQKNMKLILSIFSVNKEKGIVELMPVIFQMGILVFTHFYLDAKKS